MYRKDLLKERSNGHLASYGWYLDCLANNTPKSKHGLKEKFENTHFNKPTSIDSRFRGGKRSQNAKKLKTTKDQTTRPSGDKKDKEDLD